MKQVRFPEQVNVHFSLKTREKLEEVAGKLNMSMSEYIRTRIEADIFDDSARIGMRRGKA